MIPERQPSLEASASAAYHPRKFELSPSLRRALMTILEKTREKRISTPEALKACRSLLRMEIKEQSYRGFAMDHVTEILRRVAARQRVRFWKNWGGRVEFEG